MNPARLKKILELEIAGREGYILIRRHHTAKVDSTAQIGAEGQGYEDDGHRWRKMPQLGGVVIERDVEIQAHAVIQRGALSDTVIGEGTKIGPFVLVGHGTELGALCFLCGGVKIAGSAVLGAHVWVGMGARISNKAVIGDGCLIGQGANVLCDVPAGERWVGNPARRLD